MKTRIMVEQEIEVRFVKVDFPLRYDDEDSMPKDFPLRVADRWEAVIDVDTGVIQNWPQGKTGDIREKVVDCGAYTLYDAEMNELSCLLEEYVPNQLIPGEYGDYVEMQIDETGKVTNWPSDPSVSEFFPNDDED